MENRLTPFPPEHRLGRKEVLYHLKWSRTTLWRRERDGLRFAAGEIAVCELREWLARREPRPAAALVRA